MRKLIVFIFIACIVLSRAGMAAAEEQAPETPRRADLALQTGIVLPQVASHLGSAVGIRLDVGVRLGGRLSVFGAVGYSQPGVSHSQSDPRLAAGDYTTSTTQRELTLATGLVWRFLPMTGTFNVYAGLGAKVYLLETITSGSSSGQSFGENRETSTRSGATGLGGLEYRLGFGAACAELELGGSDLPHLITGDVATTAVAFTVGYRLFF